MSWFSQSAWTWDEKVGTAPRGAHYTPHTSMLALQTQEYYLHLYAIEQPDLNWTNEEGCCPCPALLVPR